MAKPKTKTKAPAKSNGVQSIVMPSASSWVKYNDGENPPLRSGEYLCAVRDITNTTKRQYGNWQYEIWRYDRRGDFWETEQGGVMNEYTMTVIFYWSPIPKLPKR